MSRFATSSLIFVVLKLGLEAIKDEWERMAFAFFFATLFLSDFVSYWFQVYSSYLLDEESHETPFKPLKYFLKALKLPFIQIPMTLLSELYVVDHYMAFYSGHPLYSVFTLHSLYPLAMQLAFYGLILKHIHNVLHLVVSAIRIVKLDVKQKNEEFATKTK